MKSIGRIKPRIGANPRLKKKTSLNLTFTHGMVIWLITTLLGIIAYPVAAQSPCTLSFVAKWSGEEKGMKPLRNPGGVCAGPEGNVYVADTGNHRLVVLDSRGKWVREIGGLGIGANQLNRPSDVTAKLGLDILVADTGNDRIQRFNRRLGYISTTKNPAAFTEPVSLDVSEFGDLFILDDSRRRIVKIEVLVNQLVFFGGVGYGSGELEDPKDVDVMRDGTVWVADGSTGNVVQFDLFGNILACHFVVDGVDVRGVASDEKYVWVAAEDRVGYFDQRGKFNLCLDKSDLTQLGMISTDDIAVSKQRVIVLDSSGGNVLWFLKQESATE